MTGLDASEEISIQARAHAASLGLDNVEFVTGDAYALDFDDDTFDVVHAHQVLQHLAEPVAALREFRRVTKPGGVVAARDVDYGGVMISPPNDLLAEWLRVYEAVHRSNGGEPLAGRALKGWALEAGFTEVATTASAWCFSDAEERAWWGGLWAERSLESAIAPRAVEIGAADRPQLERMAQAWRSWAAEPAGVFVFPHVEIVARA